MKQGETSIEEKLIKHLRENHVEDKLIEATFKDIHSDMIFPFSDYRVNQILGIKPTGSPVQSSSVALEDGLFFPLEDEDFVYIPKIKRYVSRERTGFNGDYDACSKSLQMDGKRMITLPEFIRLLKYSKTKLPELYDSITRLGTSERAEWIGASFNSINWQEEIMGYNYVSDSNGKLTSKSEILDRNTLMENKKISLNDYINKNHTPQGLPSKNVESGEEDLLYLCPNNNHSSATKFIVRSNGLVLTCCSYPSSHDLDLGVRVVKR
jgi:hypothetical protein